VPVHEGLRPRWSRRLRPRSVTAEVDTGPRESDTVSVNVSRASGATDHGGPERERRDLSPARVFDPGRCVPDRVFDPGRCVPDHDPRNPPDAGGRAGYGAGMGASERANASDAPADWLALPDRLRADLTTAMLDRDQTTVSVLRTTLAAIANAEAPPLPDAPPKPVVGRLVEHPRLELSAADLERIVGDEIADRRDTMSRYARAGRDEPAAAMQAEITILERYLS
jgi:uncharacterized protein